MFADSHIHPLMKYVHNPKFNDVWKNIKWTPFRIPLVNDIVGIPPYSQSDFKQLAKGGFQIVFCALHPPEQKILFTSPKSEFGQNVIEKIASQAISIPKKTIDKYQKKSYNHYQTMLAERKLLLDNQNREVRLRIDGKRRMVKYQVVSDFSEVREIIERNKNNEDQFTIAVVLTIEGVHSLGRGHLSFYGAPNKNNVSDDVLLERLDQVKGINVSASKPGWAQSPIVMNVTHAFQNSICGHSQAFGEGFRKIFKYDEPIDPADAGLPNYEEALNRPLADIGRRLILRMLNLDEESQQRQDPGKRIIPDIKHMSTKTRKEYYDIIDSFNEQEPDPAKRIPVVMSHAAVNGKSKLTDHLSPKDEEKEYANSKTFNPWSINLYDDEIVRVHETFGLIGLIFDERVSMGKKKAELLNRALRIDPDYNRNNAFYRYSREGACARVITDQIEHIVKTVAHSHSPVKRDLIWDRICIGSDFDGQINPLDEFTRATHFENFKDELAEQLKESRFISLLQGRQIDEIVENICFWNIYHFLERNF